MTNSISTNQANFHNNQNGNLNNISRTSFSVPPAGSNSTAKYLDAETENIQVELDSSILKFDPKAAVEVILYVASKVPEVSFHKIAKLLYFADRLHLERYGRFITGDHYIAMQYGPVPSRVYDLLKSAKNSFSFPEDTQQDQPFTVKHNYIVSPLRSPDMEWISESEITCLDETISELGDLPFQILTERSHDSAWKSVSLNEEISIEAIVHSIGNPEGLLEHLKNPNP